MVLSQNSVVGQSLPGSLSFTVAGAFENAIAEGSKSILIADNNLTNGYGAGMDLTDAPTSLKTNGPTGSAAFQWGEAATNSSYAHSSALWFEPLSASNVKPEQFFNLGNLYYRNGTIKNNTGASAVDISINMGFSSSSTIGSLTNRFTTDLINSVNGQDPVASADIVSLQNSATLLNYTDENGNAYYFELSFKVDQNTLDGTLSTADQFRVFEGSQGSAQLLGRFTTTPGSIPEPSTALLGALASLALLRRKR